MPGALSEKWRTDLKESITDLGELARMLELPITSFDADDFGFPLLVPRTFVSRMKKGDMNDPILLQVLPRAVELDSPSGFSIDPLKEHGTDSCLLQKYDGRALVLATGECSVHCRFCFRRHFPNTGFLDQDDFFETIRNKLHANGKDSPVEEIVLSGGDPLILTDTALERIIYYIEKSTYVNRVRVHSRVPITIPDRITDDFLAIFSNRKRKNDRKLVFYLVLHLNHPNEIDEKVSDSLAKLVEAGIPLLSQTVLLRGINDDPETLCELFTKCVNNRVLPYYLHQLDKVSGAAHFEVSDEKGKFLITEIRKKLPGYAVPRYVRETAGESSKTIIE